MVCNWMDTVDLPTQRFGSPATADFETPSLDRVGAECRRGASNCFCRSRSGDKPVVGLVGRVEWAAVSFDRTRMRVDGTRVRGVVSMGMACVRMNTGGLACKGGGG